MSQPANKSLPANAELKAQCGLAPCGLFGGKCQMKETTIISDKLNTWTRRECEKCGYTERAKPKPEQ